MPLRSDNVKVLLTSEGVGWAEGAHVYATGNTISSAYRAIYTQRDRNDQSVHEHTEGAGSYTKRPRVKVNIQRMFVTK